MAMVLKTIRAGDSPRGFESHALRLKVFTFDLDLCSRLGLTFRMGGRHGNPGGFARHRERAPVGYDRERFIEGRADRRHIDLQCTRLAYQ